MRCRYARAVGTGGGAFNFLRASQAHHRFSGPAGRSPEWLPGAWLCSAWGSQRPAGSSQQHRLRDLAPRSSGEEQPSPSQAEKGGTFGAPKPGQPLRLYCSLLPVKGGEIKWAGRIRLSCTVRTPPPAFGPRSTAPLGSCKPHLGSFVLLSHNWELQRY